MSVKYFYDKSSLPVDFVYPQEYVRFVEGDTSGLSPWWLTGNSPEFAELCFNVINEKLDGEKILVPFAKDDDSGDIACFDGDDASGNPKIYFDTGQESMTSIDWEKRYYLSDFVEWLRMVKDGD